MIIINVPSPYLGYGGFSISIDPFFSPTLLTFLQKYGAVLAVPNIRGGAEFGEDWHKAGIREKKVFNSGEFSNMETYVVLRGMCLMTSSLPRMF